jgi:DNA-binding Lrp family transcriptional regulator
MPEAGSGMPAMLYTDPKSALADKAGLSPSACLRRVRLLEESGTIRGYTALINDRATGFETVVIVQISLERQTDEYLRLFEKAA